MLKKDEGQYWGTLLKGSSPDNKSRKYRYYRKGLSYTLAKLAYDKFNGEHEEIDLFVTIIIRAAADRDWEFLNGEGCEWYCERLGLDYALTLELIRRTIEHIEYGVGFINVAELDRGEEE